MTDTPASAEDVLELYLARVRSGEELDPESFACLYPALGSELSPALAAAAVLVAIEQKRRKPALHDFEIPARVGAFRVVREIGRGGMGVVLEAVEEPLGRRVALKMLTPELLASASARARFQREAELAARLDHSGIATIFGAGVADERPWIAMRYVEGETLARAIARSRGEGARCVRTTRADTSGREAALAVAATLARIARALQSAHEQGVVHRDIKPSNIIVASDGAAVLLDFGLAITEESEGSSLTRTGDTPGTPAYMAPELVGGERTRHDAQSDVYALGVTLYECVTLRRPFDAPTPVALYRSILAHTPSSVRTLNRDVPRDLMVIIATAMERDRARRYRSAAALADDLEACVAGRPIAARPVPMLGRIARWTRREPRQALLVSTLFAALIGLALFGGTWWASRDEVFAAERAADERERDQLLAEGYDKLETNDSADVSFRRALALDPDCAEAVAGLAFVEVEHDHARAALDFLAGASDTPGYAALRSFCVHEPVTQDLVPSFSAEATTLDLFLVGMCLSRQADRGPHSQQQRDHARALALLAKAVTRAPHARPFLHARWAIAAGDARDERATRSAVEALLALWPDSPRPVFVAGMALYHFDPRAAEPHLKRATQLLPREAAPCQVLANLYRKLGDCASAELWSWRALARHQDAETWNSLGIALMSRGCNDEAIAAWMHAIAVQPWHQNSWMNLGQLFYVTSEFEMARFCFERCLERDPLDAHAYGILGLAHQGRGDLATARAHYARALELAPRPPGFWAEFIAVELELGERAEAEAALSVGLEITPDNPMLAHMYEELVQER